MPKVLHINEKIARSGFSNQPTTTEAPEFWAVFFLDGEEAPQTLEEAEKQAEKLAAANPGKRFFVMHSETCFQVTGPITVSRRPPQPMAKVKQKSA